MHLYTKSVVAAVTKYLHLGRALNTQNTTASVLGCTAKQKYKKQEHSRSRVNKTFRSPNDASALQESATKEWAHSMQQEHSCRAKPADGSDSTAAFTRREHTYDTHLNEALLDMAGVTTRAFGKAPPSKHFLKSMYDT